MQKVSIIFNPRNWSNPAETRQWIEELRKLFVTQSKVWPDLEVSDRLMPSTALLTDTLTLSHRSLTNSKSIMYYLILIGNDGYNDTALSELKRLVQNNPCHVYVLYQALADETQTALQTALGACGELHRIEPDEAAAAALMTALSARISQLYKNPPATPCAPDPKDAIAATVAEAKSPTLPQLTGNLYHQAKDDMPTPVPMPAAPYLARLANDPGEKFPTNPIRRGIPSVRGKPEKPQPVHNAASPYLAKVLFQFHEQPPPEHDPYWYPEDLEETQEGVSLSIGNEWVMAAASRRGLSHWNKGTPRDDAFKLGTAGQWNVMVVADGAGSARYSRETANQSVELAVQTICNYAVPAPVHADAAQAQILSAMQDAIRAVHDYQTTFTRENNYTLRETYTTFLMLVHQPLENGCVIGVLQVGDGFMFGASKNKANRLTPGDRTEEAGTARFVTSFSAQELVDRVKTYTFDNPIELFILVTDGIEEDLKPNQAEFQQNKTLDRKFEEFGTALRNSILRWPRWDEWGALLEHLISYEKSGSFDDRTIAVLTLHPPDEPIHEDEQ